MNKNFLIICSIVVIVAAAGYLAYKATAPKSAAPSAASASSPLSVHNQMPGTSVFVDSINMKGNGFVTVRKDDGGSPGKIIGVSILLPPGENKNINIGLSEEVRDGQIIYVLVHTDGNNDDLFEFPGPDIPAKDSSGNIILARINVDGALANKQTTTAEDNSKNNVVALTEKGVFIPESLEIKVGEYVTFVNSSDFDMWIASDPHPSHNALPGFDEHTSVKTGGKYMYRFTQTGTWKYHNETNPTKGGQIIVK